MKEENLISKKDVSNIIFDALSYKIGERLKGYSSPLDKIVDEVVEEQGDKIRTLCRNALRTIVSGKNFEKNIKEEFEHKVAKSLVGKLEGSVAKAVDVLGQNPQMRAEMILAIEKIITKQSLQDKLKE